MKRLQGKNAIITGARTGIGFATLELFAQHGANIWACVKQEDREFSDRIADIAEVNGVWIKPVYFDLSDDHGISTGIKSIILEHKNIDILVNSAGVVGGNALFQMTKITEMKRVFDVNFFSVMSIIQWVSRVMCRQKSGSIINISSIAGLDGDPAQLEYSASKAAISCATKKLAIEFGKYGLRVNAVAPGMTDTKMLAQMNRETQNGMLEKVILSRIADPLEIAGAILFLASDESSYITGQTIRVDGGIK